MFSKDYFKNYRIHSLLSVDAYNFSDIFLIFYAKRKEGNKKKKEKKRNHVRNIFFSSFFFFNPASTFYDIVSLLKAKN